MQLELEPDREPYSCKVYFAASHSLEKSDAEIEFQKHLREASNLFHRILHYKSESPVGDCDFCLRALFNIFWDDLSWEDNEEPGHPETWSQVAELPRIYDKLEWLLARYIQRLSEKSGTKRSRRQADGTKPQPLTGLQTEALELFAELRSYTQTGKRMGIGRKSAEQHVKAAYKKLGAELVRKKMPKTTRLPTDKDGQANVVAEGDGQVRIRKNPRRSKPVREDQ